MLLFFFFVRKDKILFGWIEKQLGFAEQFQVEVSKMSIPLETLSHSMIVLGPPRIALYFAIQSCLEHYVIAVLWFNA